MWDCQGYQSNRGVGVAQGNLNVHEGAIVGEANKGAGTTLVHPGLRAKRLVQTYLQYVEIILSTLCKPQLVIKILGCQGKRLGLELSLRYSRRNKVSFNDTQFFCTV